LLVKTVITHCGHIRDQAFVQQRQPAPFAACLYQPYINPKVLILAACNQHTVNTSAASAGDSDGNAQLGLFVGTLFMQVHGIDVALL
jgi:hypothetical protein